MRTYCLLIVFYLLLLTSINGGEIKKGILSNQLPVIVEKLPSNKGVTFVLLVKDGLESEPEDKHGIRTLLQELLLKNLSKKLEVWGGVVEGKVEWDYTLYSLRVVKENAFPALSLLSSILTSPAWREEDLEASRQKALIDIKEELNQPFTRLLALFAQTFYKNSPYRFNPRGEEVSINNITLQDIKEFYKRHYITSNMIISLNGPLEYEDIIKWGEKHLSFFPQGKRESFTFPSEPFLLFSKEVTRTIIGEKSWIMIATPAPAISSSDYWAMKIIQVIMGGNMNSRLWKVLREEKGLAYELETFYPPLVGPSFFAIYVSTASGSKEECKKIILQTVSDFKSGGITAQEITQAKEYLIGQYLLTRDDPLLEASSLAYWEALGPGYKNYLHTPDYINGITARDLQMITEKYFVFYVFTALVPIYKTKGGK